ncbi:MAG: anthranilate synthase component II, partial [Thermoanaerobaculia bacterium]
MILVIDNYDSFTYNLVQILSTLDEDVRVVRNDALSVDAVLAAKPDRIVVSPGPGRPEDAGISCELVRRNETIPLLGVCLGHQALGAVFGGTISRAPVLMHGKTSEIAHDGRGLF